MAIFDWKPGFLPAGGGGGGIPWLGVGGRASRTDLFPGPVSGPAGPRSGGAGGGPGPPGPSLFEEGGLGLKEAGDGCLVLEGLMPGGFNASLPP